MIVQGGQHQNFNFIFLFLFLPFLAFAKISEGGAFNTPPAKTSDFSIQNISGNIPSRSDSAKLIFSPGPSKSAQNPLFSPMGERLAFTIFHKGYNQGPAGIYCLSLKDKSVSQVFFEKDQDSVNLPGSCWNKTNDKIVFSSDRSDRDEIWFINPEGKNLFQVTKHNETTHFIEPSFSPDGKWIVFEAKPDGPDDQVQSTIWKVKTDGTNLTQLTNDSAGKTDDRQPNWSPSANEILFQRRTTGGDDWNVFTMESDGSGIKQVTFSPEAATDACWSPDGKSIAYSSTNGVTNLPKIFVIPATGGLPKQITMAVSREDGAPCWSPDGKCIAFESHISADEESPTELWEIPIQVSPDAAIGPRRDSVLSNVKFWAYQIQGLEDLNAINLLAESKYDLLVVEPTRTDWSSGNKSFNTKEMVAKLKNSKASDGNQPKLVLAYIDIGEAENWRWYWTWSNNVAEGKPLPLDWPIYILTTDPDGWQGNFPVAYWDSNWKDILLYGRNTGIDPGRDYRSILDEVLKDGFDGVYLDWVEGFENAEVKSEAEKQGKDPALEMIKLIREIKDYASKRTSQFIIIQQNAAALCEGHPELFSIIDGIAQEAIWYDGTAFDDWNQKNGFDDENQSSLVDYYIGLLDRYKAAGLPVFNCEYALKKAPDAYLKSSSKGYIPYCTRRSLSKLSTTPPPGMKKNKSIN